jgi:hypothetical protein
MLGFGTISGLNRYRLALGLSLGFDREIDVENAVLAPGLDLVIFDVL